MIELKGKFEKVEQHTNRVKLIFSTADKTSRLEFLQLLKTEGYLVFNPDRLRSEVLEIVANKKIGISDLGKTPSEKLRKTLFLVAQARGLNLQFDDFYREEMEKICNHYQSKYLL
jgi:hypothetical protein